MLIFAVYLISLSIHYRYIAVQGLFILLLSTLSHLFNESSNSDPF